MKLVPLPTLCLLIAAASCSVKNEKPQPTDTFAYNVLNDPSTSATIAKMIDARNHPFVTGFVRDSRSALKDGQISLDEVEVAISADVPQLAQDFPYHEKLFIAVRNDDIVFPLLVNDFNRANQVGLIKSGERSYFLLFYGSK